MLAHNSTNIHVRRFSQLGVRLHVNSLMSCHVIKLEGQNHGFVKISEMNIDDTRSYFLLLVVFLFIIVEFR